MEKQKLSLGIDLGGTKVDIGAVDFSGKLISRRLIKTRVQDGPQAIIDDIVAAARDLEKELEAEIVSVGIGMAGQIERGTGIVQFAPNVGWRHFPLQDKLHQQLQLPVYVLNDVRAATWGEWLYGAARGCDNFICLFVGTGIGSGIVINGQVMEGSNNCAGEVGHMTIDLDGPHCNCGNRGCFEAVAGGLAIGRRAREVIAYDPSGGQVLLDRVGGKVEEVTAKEVFAAYAEGVPLAKKVVEEAREGLIAGVASLANIFNPSLIVLGGGVIQGFPDFLTDVQEEVPQRVLQAIAKPLKIVRAQLLEEAGVIGAAAFSKQSLDNEKGEG